MAVIAFSLIVAGTMLVYAGMSGESLVDAIKGVLSGKGSSKAPATPHGAVAAGL